MAGEIYRRSYQRSNHTINRRFPQNLLTTIAGMLTYGALRFFKETLPKSRLCLRMTENRSAQDGVTNVGGRRVAEAIQLKESMPLDLVF